MSKKPGKDPDKIFCRRENRDTEMEKKSLDFAENISQNPERNIVKYFDFTDFDREKQNMACDINTVI